MRLALKLGLIHALVDAACAALLYAEVVRHRFPDDTLVALVLLYNILAFGSQWLVGILADFRETYRTTGALGTLLVAAAILVEPLNPWSGPVLAGVGNACFHVGAGALVLRQSYGRAAQSGVFVGPGALGLVAGLWLGLNSNLWHLPALALLMASGLFISRVTPAISLNDQIPGPNYKAFLVPAVILLLGSVAVRAAVGGLLSGSWKTPTAAVFALAIAAMAGKGAGGFLSDLFGWRSSGTLALLLAAPLIVYGLRQFHVALLGMLVFQLTMPVTLAAVYLAFPRRPGLAFGLPCLALLLGALPGLTKLLDPWAFTPLVAPLIVLSALMLFLGLGHPLPPCHPPPRRSGCSPAEPTPPDG